MASALPISSMGKARADDPVQLLPGSNENPAYPGLGRVIGAAQRETAAAISVLRTDWLEIAGLNNPGKALGGDVVRGLRGIIESFLRIFSGRDRSVTGYVNAGAEDGILQQTALLAHVAGTQRAATLTGRVISPSLSEAQRVRILTASFTRLSEDGRLRFETRLNEIRDAMAQAFRDGQSPQSIALRLGRDLDGYEQGRLRTLIRTESAIASEGAIADGFRAAGIQRYSVVGNAASDELCASVIAGGPYLLSDDGNRPPLHPNCLCSQIAGEE